MEAVCFAKLWYSSAKLQHAVITWMIYNTKYRNILVSTFQDFTARRCSERSVSVRLLGEMSMAVCSGLLDYDTRYSEGVGASEDVVLYGMGAGEDDCNCCSTFENPVVRDQRKLRL